MKKSLLIALIMVMLLAACAPVAPAPAAIQPTVETQASAPTAVPTQAPQPTQAPTEAPTPTQAASPTLTTNSWQWVGYAVEQFKLDQPGNYLVTFQEDGTVAIKADCNNVGGSYTADDSGLEIKLGPMTTAACPPISPAASSSSSCWAVQPSTSSLTASSSST